MLERSRWPRFNIKGVSWGRGNSETHPGQTSSGEKNEAIVRSLAPLVCKYSFWGKPTDRPTRVLSLIVLLLLLHSLRYLHTLPKVNDWH